MTKDEIKKALGLCFKDEGCNDCNKCPYFDDNYCTRTLQKDALNLITEQEKSIQVAQDSILSLAQQNQEYREQQVKQAKIDVLNELKEKCKFDGHTVAVYKNDIDELIKEVENE